MNVVEFFIHMEFFSHLHSWTIIYKRMSKEVGISSDLYDLWHKENDFLPSAKTEMTQASKERKRQRETSSRNKDNNDASSYLRLIIEQ